MWHYWFWRGSSFSCQGRSEVRGQGQLRNIMSRFSTDACDFCFQSFWKACYKCLAKCISKCTDIWESHYYIIINYIILLYILCWSSVLCCSNLALHITANHINVKWVHQSTFCRQLGGHKTWKIFNWKSGHFVDENQVFFSKTSGHFSRLKPARPQQNGLEGPFVSAFLRVFNATAHHEMSHQKRLSKHICGSPQCRGSVVAVWTTMHLWFKC